MQLWEEAGDRAPIAQSWTSDGLFFLDYHGVGIFAFQPGQLDITVWPLEDVPPETLNDVFFRQLQPIVLQATGWQAMHASASGVDGSLLVMCGRAHSGKSTFAYGLAQRGYPQYTDDQLVWRSTKGAIGTRALQFTPRLRPASLEFFADRAGTVPDPGIVVGDGISRIVTLNQSALGDEISLTRVPPQDAFIQLLGHAHLFNPQDRNETARLIRDYTDLVNRVPVFALTYPCGFVHFERVLDTLVST